jgi:hypothetical protein
MNAFRFFGMLTVVSAIVFAILGAWVAGRNGRSRIEGGVLGFFFGPIAVLAEALLPSRKLRRAVRSYALTDEEVAERYPWIAERMGRQRKW